jgi:ABC-type amino acid transport substrate-binding protein
MGRMRTCAACAALKTAMLQKAGLLLSRSSLDDAVRDAIGRALHDMREDGTLAAIVARYVPDRKEAESMLIPLK